MSDVTQDGDWATVDLDAAGNQEQEQIEIEIEEDTATEQEEEPVRQEIKADDIETTFDNEVVQEEEEESRPKELEGIKTKGAEKRIKQLIRQRKERDEELQKLREELESLKSSSVQKDLQLSSSLKNNISSHENQLEANIETARQLYKQAVEAGDTDGMLLAQENMSKTYAEMSQVEQRKQAWEEYNNAVEQSQQQQQQLAQSGAAPEYDPKAVEWAGRNSWFGQDQIMTAAALTIDQELKNEGYDPSDEDFYEEVDNRLRQKYPNRFQVGQGEEDTPRLQDTTANSAQVVAGASRTPKTSSNSKNKIKLTQEDVRLANKWGIPLEKYAAEKLKVEQAEGEYTSVYT